MGVGVRGMGSIAVRGSFQVTVVMGVTARGNLDPEVYKTPHWIAGWQARISVVISMFLFSQSFVLKDKPYSNWLDNWEGKDGSEMKTQSDAEQDWRRALTDLDMSEMLKELQIIPDAKLASTSEFTGSSKVGTQADEEDEGDEFDWEDIREEQDRVMPLDDGTNIAYAVYSLATELEEEPEQYVAGQSDQQSEDESIVVEEELSGKEFLAQPPTEEVVVQSVAGQDAQVSSDNQTAGDPVTLDDVPSDVEHVVDDPANETAVQEDAAQDQDKETKAHAKVLPTRQPSSIVYDSVDESLSPDAMLEDSLYVMADSDAEPILVDDPAVAGISNHGGIRPQTDKIIAPYVFGDPHIKIATLYAAVGESRLRVTCTFRIGTVTINGQPRSRIIMTVIDASSDDGGSDAAAKRYVGYSKPLDFELKGLSGVKHADLNDYEFDIAFTTLSSETGTIDMVHLVVVSGKRTNGDGTSIVEASTHLVFSYINFHASSIFGRISYLVMSKSASQALSQKGSMDDSYHCISNVRIATDGTSESTNLLVGLLDRYSNEADAVLTDNYGDGTGGTVRTRVVFVIIDQDENELWIPKRDNVDDAMCVSAIENGTVLSMRISPKIDNAYTVTLTSTEETYFFVMKLSDDDGAFTSIKMAPMLESSMRLVPWPQEGCFLTTYPTQEYFDELNANGGWKDPSSWDRSKWVLQKAWWEEELDNPAEPNSGTPILHFERIGPDNFNNDTFGINSSGTFIFWSQARENNDARIYDDDGSYEPLDEENEPLYQLMACRVYGGFFSDPFVAAEVDHHMSDIEIVAARDNLAPLEVMSVEHIATETDAEGRPRYLNHEANVWYTAVPHTVCATVVDSYSPVPYVLPGGEVTFHVTIRNDGNCYLKGCTLQLCLHNATVNENGETVASTSAQRVEGSVAKLWICEETLLESHFNPMDGSTGKLENVEVDFSLAPGKRSLYKVRIPIPSDWTTGDKFVSLVASVDAREDVAEGGSLATQADGGIVYHEYGVEPGEYRPYLQRATPREDKNRTYMDVIKVDESVAYAGDTHDAPLTHWTGSDRPTSGDSTSGSSTGTPGSSTSGTGGTTQAQGGVSGGANLARTGDSISGAAAGLAAVAGTALVAYGAARARNNKDERDGL